MQQHIKIDDKYDLENLMDILLKNGYTVTVSGNGYREEDDKFDMYDVTFDKIYYKFS